MQAGIGLEKMFDWLIELGKLITGGFILLLVMAGMFGIASY
tara:strand:- start:716 stop:838 length:123 start_codon:yes stop_codon:yes gene_type:complete